MWTPSACPRLLASRRAPTADTIVRSSIQVPGSVSSHSLLSPVPSSAPDPVLGPAPTVLRPYAITSRQLEIIALVVEGFTNHEIAARLHISSRTVQSHLAIAMQRLQASSRTQLAVTALRSGIVPLFPAPEQSGPGAVLSHAV